MGCQSAKAAVSDANEASWSPRNKRGVTSSPPAKKGPTVSAHDPIVPEGDRGVLWNHDAFMDIPCEVAEEPTRFITVKASQHFNPGAKLRDTGLCATPTDAHKGTEGAEAAPPVESSLGAQLQAFFGGLTAAASTNTTPTTSSSNNNTSSSSSAPSAPPRMKPYLQPTGKFSNWGEEAVAGRVVLADDIVLPTSVVDWFSNLDRRGQETDIAFKCKAPLVLFQAGQVPQARAALHSCVQALQHGAQSSLEYYSREYVQAPWFWLFWAATGLQDQDVASTCYKRLGNYRHRFSDSGLVKGEYTTWNRFEADFYATALLAKAALIRGAQKEALSCGWSLVRAVDGNHRLMTERKSFCTRWTFERGFLDDATDHYCCVRQDAADQNWSALAMPAFVLLELTGEARDPSEAEAFQEAAERLLSFLAAAKLDFSGLGGCLARSHLALASGLAQRPEFTKKFGYSLEDVAQGRLGGLTPTQNLQRADEVAECWLWRRLGQSPRTASMTRL